MCQTILTFNPSHRKESFMGNPSRRAFVMTVVASGSALAASRASARPAAAALSETDPQAAPCQLFAGKQVAGKGWCSAWAKKA